MHDYNSTMTGVTNTPSSGYALFSNGTQTSWNKLGTSCLNDFSMSSVLQNDSLYANVSNINSITTSTGTYIFSNDINTRTLISSNNNFARIVYGNKYVVLDSTMLVYTSTDGVYFTQQTSSNLNTIIQTNYNAPYLIWDGSKYIPCGYCIAAGPGIAYSTDGITWTGATVCNKLHLNYIAYNGSLYLCQEIFGYLLKSTNGIACTTVS